MKARRHTAGGLFHLWASHRALKQNTAAGCAALLRYVDQHEVGYGAQFFDDCAEPVCSAGRGFLSRIAEAIEGA